MQVKEIMTNRIESADADSTVSSAAEKMKSIDVGILPVQEEDNIVGMITDRDIVIRVVAEGRNAEEVRVRDVMSRGVVCCSSEDTIEEAAHKMEEHQVRRLLVCDPHDVPIGILSLGDIAAKTRIEPLTGEILEAISHPSEPKL